MADSNLLVLAKEFSKLRNDVKEVLKMPVGPEGKQGERGLPGKDGKDGLNGRDGIGLQGPAGASGRDGRDGKDGSDGVDGKDGVSVINAYIDFDGSLVIELSDGNQIDAGFVNVEARDSVIQQLKNGALSLNELLPAQTGNIGKALLTNGTDAYWGTVSGGGSSGVTQIVAGTNITIDPVGGTGIVTINASGGGVGGAVDSVNGQTGVVVLDYADVGAQPYNANTVVDASYVHTDNNYTTTEKSKLAGIAVGAEVNVNADWNAVSGDAQILNKPTLGTAAASNTGDFATAAQGALADTAIQPSTSAELANLVITGDLDVQGTMTTTNTDTMNVADPMIYVARDSTGNTVDMGVVGHFDDGIYQHTGIVRDATDGKWKLFSGVTTEPTTTVDFTSAAYDTLKLGTLETTSSQVSNWDTAYGWGNHASAGYLTSSAIGSTVQAYDADLTSWAAIAPSTKQNTLVSGTSIKTVNSTSLLGSGDVAVQPTLVSGTNIKTINSTSLLGSGDIVISGSAPTQYYYRKNTATTLTSATGNQSIFGLTSGVTLTANTIYEIEGEFQLTTTGTTSHTEAFGFVLTTATLSNMGVSVRRLTTPATAATGDMRIFLTAVTPTAITAAITTSQTAAYRISGTIAISTGGTCNPVLAFSAAPGGTSTVVAGAWMSFTAIGTTGANVSTGTWA